MATLTQSQVYTIAVMTGMKDPKLMAAIAMAESSGRTDVVNSIGCVGLWQINQPVHVKANPKWTQAWLKNPFNNAFAAKQIRASQGLNAWEVYTNGMYLRYMGANVKADQQAVSQVQQAGNDFWKDPFGVWPEWMDPYLKGPLDEFFGDEESDIFDITPDWMGDLPAVSEALKATGDLLVNPRTWLRVAYGVVGVALVVGGLFLITKGTVVQQTVGQVSKAVKKGTS